MATNDGGDEGIDRAFRLDGRVAAVTARFVTGQVVRANGGWSMG